MDETKNYLRPKKEDIVIYGRIVSASTEGVVCDASQVFSDDYIKKYNNSPQFKTDGSQSSINDKLIQLYSDMDEEIKNQVDTAIPTEKLNEIFV